MELNNMKKIEVEIDRNGRIWYLGMRYYSDQEIHGSDWNEHPETEDEYQPTEEEIHCCGG